jgi:hypothetical protein
MQLFEAFCPDSPIKYSNWSGNICTRIHMVKVKEFRLFGGVHSSVQQIFCVTHLAAEQREKLRKREDTYSLPKPSSHSCRSPEVNSGAFPVSTQQQNPPKEFEPTALLKFSPEP